MLRCYVLAAVAGILTLVSSSQAATLAQWNFEQFSDASAIPIGFELIPTNAMIMDVSGNGRHLSKPQFIAIPSSTVEGMNGGVAHDYACGAPRRFRGCGRRDAAGFRSRSSWASRTGGSWFS